MTLLLEYQQRDTNPPQDVARKVLFALYYDLEHRGGFDDVIADMDPEIRDEFLQEQLAIIHKKLRS